MRYFIYSLFFGIILLGCSGSGKSSANNPKLPEIKPASYYITIVINQSESYSFSKRSDEWSGKFLIFGLNEDNERVLKKTLFPIQDSSWDDFEDFLMFLNILELTPQNEIEGWVPDSSVLPRRVYNIEVFDGDTTRSFSYQDPINGIRDFWQAQSLLTFMTYIENDLRWVEKPE